MADVKRPLVPYVCSQSTGEIRINCRHEHKLRQMAKVFGKDLPPIRSKKDLGMAILYAQIGASLTDMKKKAKERINAERR